MDKKELTKLVSSFLLGDGCLRVWKDRPNMKPAYFLSQVDKHEEYVKWQAEVIGEICPVTIRHYPPSIRDGVSRQGHFKLESKQHPFFETLRERWYHNGKKTVSLHDMKQLDWQMAAIWFMDDGYTLNSSHKGHDGNVFLCTDCFSEAEVLFLQKAVYSSLGVAMDIRKRGTTKDGSRIYRLMARNAQADKFLEGVRPYIFPSFNYKLRTKGPELSGDDIVCSTEESVEGGRNDLPGF